MSRIARTRWAMAAAAYTLLLACKAQPADSRAASATRADSSLSNEAVEIGNMLLRAGLPIQDSVRTGLSSSGVLQSPDSVGLKSDANAMTVDSVDISINVWKSVADRKAADARARDM